MRAFHRIFTNLVFVKVDRQAALGHWLQHVAAVQRMHDEPDHMASLFLRDNFVALQRSKAVCGILGHSARRSRNWLIHTVRERSVQRKAADRYH